MTAVVMGCDSANIDQTTQQCTAPYWTVQTTLIPPLDATGGAEIGVAILLAWATAWCYQLLKRGAE